MKIITKKKQIRIGKLIGACRYIAELEMANTCNGNTVDYMTKMIEILAEIAIETGGYAYSIKEIQKYKEEIEAFIGLGDDHERKTDII